MDDDGTGLGSLEWIDPVLILLLITHNSELNPGTRDSEGLPVHRYYR